MRSILVRCLLLVCALVALPASGFAQEAVLSGTVSDSTGGVLPGVTVTAVHEATGNRFVGVTDERGMFRIPARIGTFNLTAELQGFNTVTLTGITLLVGQTATVPMQMAVSSLQETVTVTGEAPLLDVVAVEPGWQHRLRRRCESLPAQGGDWTSLALLAPGNRTTSMGAGQPVQDRTDVREFQLNMDGQQVTQNMGTGGQPLYSRDVDCGVPVHLQPLRRQPGPLIGRPGERGHQVRHEPARWHRSSATSVIRTGTPRIPSSTSSGRTRTSSISGTIGGPIVTRSAALLRQLRVRPVAEDEHLEHAVSVVQRRPSAGSRPRRWAAAAWTTSWRPARD